MEKMSRVGGSIETWVQFSKEKVAFIRSWSDVFAEITRFPPAILSVGKVPKATAVTAVLKNDFILISLFIFIAHIVYVSATMSRVKS